MSSIDPEIMHRLENATVPRPSDSKAALAEINRLTAEIGELRAIGDSLVSALEMGLFATAQVFMTDWQEARRG